MTLASVLEGWRLDQPDPIMRLVVEAARLRRGWCVLDVGCGTGTTSVLAADVVGQRGMVVGMDVDRESIALAAAWTGERREVTFVWDDARIHPFATAAFDAVISRSVLSGSHDAEAVFRQLGRIVRPRGRLAYVAASDGAPDRALLHASGFVDVRIEGLDDGLGHPGQESLCSATRAAA